jgi:hypothetical protein
LVQQQPETGKIYQVTIKYPQWQQNIPNGRKIDQMAIKYTNIFHCKTLQNLKTWDFWFENMPSGNPGPKVIFLAFRSGLSAPVCSRQGCQMVYFQTKNPFFGKFWRVLQLKMLLYFMAIWSYPFKSIWYTLWPFGMFYGYLVYFSPFWYVVPKKIWQPWFTVG